MARRDELQQLFAEIDAEKQKVIAPLFNDIVFMEGRLEELRKLPHIRIHPKDSSRQETTAAGKQYKEIMQTYLNALKVLLTMLYRTESSAADDLIKKLSEFEL